MNEKNTMGCIDLPSNIDQQDQPWNTSDEKEIVEKTIQGFSDPGLTY